MARDRSPSPGEQKDRRKRKKTRSAGDSSDPKGDSQTLTSDSTPRDPSPDERKRLGNGKTTRYVRDDYVVILRGALDFRRMTGLMPSKSIFFALYDSIKDKLHESLSQERVFSKFLFLRHKLRQPPSNGHSSYSDLLYELAAKLWPKDENAIGVKNVRKKEKTQKKIEDVEMEEKNDLVEMEEVEQSYPYLVASANDFWKAYGLSNVLLETGLKRLDPLKAKALEAKLKKHFEAEMEINAELQKIDSDIFALLSATSKPIYELID
ncbi:uncharacterized protein LOC121991395 [Zingiber officinale]|uniref:Uncharacterized protein n=1 Tax=Zingiber officinale TaxID=94328 RepID=A0A8J5L0Y8_ZINOF|nr:uncharacterized protein LOC121991395 [Zingiber officinale]KAG6497440.1 hypothetical protein ZIOFF_045340 [Zingiber officinale]